MRGRLACRALVLLPLVVLLLCGNVWAAEPVAQKDDPAKHTAAGQKADLLRPPFLNALRTAKRNEAFRLGEETFYPPAKPLFGGEAPKDDRPRPAKMFAHRAVLASAVIEEPARMKPVAALIANP